MYRNIKPLLSLITIVLFSLKIYGQDSLYGKKIDSFRKKSSSINGFIKKKEKIGKAKFDYFFYKNTGRLRSITAWHLPDKPYLFIFYYIEDSIVMISPVGQQPYYISNNNLVYANEMRHNMEEIKSFIIKAKEFLLQAYRKQNKNHRFVRIGT